MPSSFLFVGGGSLGHVAPAVAVARALTEIVPDAKIHFVCAHRKEEKTFLQKEGFSFTSMPPLRRSLTFPLSWLRARKTAREILDAMKPDVIFSKGSAISVPLCMEAHKRKIPIIIHESDAVMGRANRITARWAKKVCLGFPLENGNNGQPAGIFTSPFSMTNSVYTGNPLRPEITHGKKSEGLRLANLTGKKPILLVLGGSQGAQALNEAVIHHLDALLAHCDIIHLTGRGKKGADLRGGYWSKEFVHEELADLYACADLALSRAGASVIAELAANSIPSILVPIRGLANDHQFRNATAAQQNGNCILLLQEDIDEKLESTVREFLNEEARRERILKTDHTKTPSDASRRIAKIVADCVAREPVSH